MNCPTCCSATLTQKDIEVIKVLHCEKCDGVFLHHGELKKITHPIIGDVEYSSIEEADFSKKSGITCPICDKVEMVDIYFASFSDVKMNYCPKCQGIWLPKGSLNLINKEIDKLNQDKDNWEYIFASFLSKLPF